MKYYKWAINSKTVQDMYLYKYSGDVDYNFQVNAMNNYFNYFSALNWNTRISNSDNAWLVSPTTFWNTKHLFLFRAMSHQTQMCDQIYHRKMQNEQVDMK